MSKVPWGLFLPVCVHVQNCFFFSGTQKFFSRPPASFSPRSWLRSMQGACVYTMVLVRAPTGLRGGFFRHSKSRKVVSSHGVSFRRARAKQDCGNPTISAQFALLQLYHRCISSSQARYNSSTLRQVRHNAHHSHIKLLAF